MGVLEQFKDEGKMNFMPIAKDVLSFGVALPKCGPLADLEISEDVEEVEENDVYDITDDIYNDFMPRMAKELIEESENIEELLACISDPENWVPANKISASAKNAVREIIEENIEKVAFNMQRVKSTISQLLKAIKTWTSNQESNTSILLDSVDSSIELAFDEQPIYDFLKKVYNQIIVKTEELLSAESRSKFKDLHTECFENLDACQDDLVRWTQDKQQQIVAMVQESRGVNDEEVVDLFEDESRNVYQDWPSGVPLVDFDL